MRTAITTSILFASLWLTGCAATSVRSYQATGNGSICQGPDLGTVAVLPEAAWRPDQKEPAKREAMALVEIESAFQSIPCGRMSGAGGVREFGKWSSQPDASLRNQYAQTGVDTIIFIRLEEFGPTIDLTLSLPFLWSGFNEVDFQIRVLATKTGAVLSDMRVNRKTGGAFNIRPAEWSGAELHAALSSLLEAKE